MQNKKQNLTFMNIDFKIKTLKTKKRSGENAFQKIIN